MMEFIIRASRPPFIPLPSLYIRPLVRRLAERCRDLMVKRAPMRTGELARSIRYEVRGDTAIVGPTVPYAPYVEFGTRPHEIRPRRAKALRFVVGKWWEPRRVVYARRVMHPGFRGRFFARHTVEDLHSEVPGIFAEVFRP